MSMKSALKGAGGRITSVLGDKSYDSHFEAMLIKFVRYRLVMLILTSTTELQRFL